MVVEAHGLELSALPAWAPQILGMRITVGLADITLKKITKPDYSTPTIAYLLNGATYAEIASAAFSGDNAVFNNTLSAGTTYVVGTKDPVNNYTAAFNGSVTYPVAGTYIEWNAGYREGDGYHSTWACNVLSIEVATAGGTNFQMNIGDAWKAAPLVKINIGDAWKTAASAKVNIGDAWKTIF